MLYLRDLPKPAKHLSFHPSGAYLAVSCTDGVVYIYSLSAEVPELVRKVDGVIRSLEADVEISARAIWHPDGRAFAAPTATREIQVISRNDGERQRSFSGGHMGDITALAWSANGALLASAGTDRKILLWETKSQKILARLNLRIGPDSRSNANKRLRYDHPNVINLAWHSHENIISFTTSDGELFIYPNFVPTEHAPLLEHTLQPAPFIHDPLAETSGNARKPLTNGSKYISDNRGRRRGTPDSLDDILGPDLVGDEDDFVEDDDGAGYLDNVNGYGKRDNTHLDAIDGYGTKRRATYQAWQPRLHAPFQPGSTPWRGNRRYLCK